MCNSSERCGETWHRTSQDVAIYCISFSQGLFQSPKHTNLAFLRHASTSDGKDDETCGCVAVAEASQFKGGC